MPKGHRLIDMKNKRIGKLAVIEKSDIKKDNRTHWVCKCDCGNEVVVAGKHLRKNNPTSSCGCLRIEKISSHKMTKNRFYNIWLGMKSRCNYENSSSYEHYGLKGIKVCEEWNNDFFKFKEDMYKSYLEHVEQYGEKETTIDRINVDGDYNPNNCRWATKKEQCRNTTKNKEFKAASPDGQIYYSSCQLDFANEHGLISSNISHCLNGDYSQYRGWKFEYV